MAEEELTPETPGETAPPAPTAPEPEVETEPETLSTADPASDSAESEAIETISEADSEPEPTPEPAPIAETQTKAEAEPEPEESDDSETASTLVSADASGPATETPAEPAAPESNKKWYVIKVTSNREESIKAAIERRVKIEGLEEFFGQIVIPVERTTVVKKVKETKNGEKITKEKRVVKETKKYPGYIMAEVEFNDRILYLFRETSGVGDFVGATGPLKPPPPMTELEVRRMLGDTLEEHEKSEGTGKKKVVVKLDFEKGDKVRIREGAFATLEGEVKEITTPKEAGETPQVKVVAMILGRQVEVTLDYWQVDKV